MNNKQIKNKQLINKKQVALLWSGGRWIITDGLALQGFDDAHALGVGLCAPAELAVPVGAPAVDGALVLGEGQHVHPANIASVCHHLGNLAPYQRADRPGIGNETATDR